MEAVAVPWGRGCLCWACRPGGRLWRPRRCCSSASPPPSPPAAARRPADPPSPPYVEAVYSIQENVFQQYHLKVNRKKRFTSFLSQAGMSLSKLPLGRNNSIMTSLFPPRESLVVTSRLGTGNSRTFFYGVPSGRLNLHESGTIG